MKKKQILSMFVSLLMVAGGASGVSAANIDGTMRGLTPSEILKEMNVGWNLGNTLDAFGTHSVNDETCWGNPRTTKKMIDTVKSEGFNTIRIPVSWADHVGGAPNYTIDSAWMNRVQEVVDYAMEDGMYVLLDTHHETSWLKPQNAALNSSAAELSAIWTQIAERFKDYGDHLIFEGMNEPRIVGASSEWTGGDTEGRAAVNVLNQTFIDAVRKTGGNNAERCLVICPYGNNADTNGLEGFKIPDDKNIMVAIHAYTPYGFTYEPEGNPSWATAYWDGSRKGDIESVMNKINNSLISKGVPVIITEFGAVNKNNDKEVIKWVKDFMGLANQYGIKCVWWDNNITNGSGEKFGLLDRNSCSWTRKGVADTVIQCATSTPVKPNTPSTDTTVTNYVTLKDGWYYIKNTNAQKYLQVKDNKGANAQNVEISTGTGVTGQRWYLTNVGNGYVTLKNGTGYMLDVNGAKDEDGTNVQVYTANTSSAQRFKVVSTDKNNVYGILTNASKDTKSLDVYNFGTTDGSNVCQWTYYKNTCQTWVFESCDAPNTSTPSTPTKPSTDNTVTIKVTSDWGDGAVADIIITNTTGKDLNGWTCTFTTDRPITSIWNAKIVSSNGNTYTVTNPDWQTYLPTGGSYTFGCQLGSGSSNVSVTNVSLK